LSTWKLQIAFLESTAGVGWPNENLEEVKTMPQNMRTPLRAQGGRIVDADGNEVLITGVNWFGLETETFAPHGLHKRKWSDMLDQMVNIGFNAIRLPFSTQLFHKEITPPKSADEPNTPHPDASRLTPDKPGGKDGNDIRFDINPDLAGLTGPQIMDKVVQGATDRGMMIILDRHRPSCTAQSPLWHTDTIDVSRVSEQTWIDDWVNLATRFRDNPLVIGADLHNEPHSVFKDNRIVPEQSATWGDGSLTTDWRLAAERAGKAILEANPDWLIFVEGVDVFHKQGLPEGLKAFYWHGGNLMGVDEFPVRLDSSRVVYSPHDYGPKVFHQPWFNDGTFPENLPCLWDSMWAHLVEEGTAPVVVGEFGGRSANPADPAILQVQDRQDRDERLLEAIWQQRLVKYLKDNRISYTYWTWTPDSGDTAGVLSEKDDNWSQADQFKVDLLRTYMAPRLVTPVPA
jgi:endoglucanase